MRDLLDDPRFIGGIIVGMLLVLSILVLDFVSEHLTWLPSCPTEDACYAEYDDGQWYIIEGERP